MNAGETSEHEPAAAFDGLAPLYDETFDSDPTTIRLREDLYTLILSLVPPHAKILDIACGTGTDAIALGRKGLSVTGVDISPGMIERARRKAEDVPNTPPEFLEGSLTSLSSSGVGPCDLVYSNFGGLNCIEDLAPVAQVVDTLLSPGGYFIAVVMPPVSPWEIVAGLAHLRFAHAFRRFHRSGSASGFGRHTFPVYYHSLSDLRRALRTHCDLDFAMGWNIITPPPAASRPGQTFPRLVQGLTRVENLIHSLPLLRSIGDHFVAVFRKRDTDASA